MQQGNAPTGLSIGASLSSALSRRSLINNEEYSANRAKINYLREVLENWTETNERGHNDFVRLHNDMSQLVQAGEQAK
jgi:hypothetical protein